MTLDYDFCDYCTDGPLTRFRVRPVGFTDFEGVQAPLVKVWCGECEPDDAIDPVADQAFRAALKAQGAL